MRKWYSLYDKICTERNLWKAWKRVEANAGAAGSDGQTIVQFGAQARVFLRQLRQELREKRYRPRPVRRVPIPKPDGGERVLGIPCVRDRIVQLAVVQVLEPIFDPQFSPYSHGFRPGRGCQTALALVDQALQYGYTWVVDLDIRRFFDTVDHEVLLDAVAETIADGSVLHLLRAVLRSGGMTARPTTAGEPLVQGTPQGGPLSPLLANIYLHAFDQALRAQRIPLVRYADDVVLCATTRQEAEAYLAVARQVLEGPLKLTLHPTKTRVVSIDDGFTFLGFRYVRDRQGRIQKGVRAPALAHFRQRVRDLTPRRAGQRHRPLCRVTPGWVRQHRRLREVLQELNRFLRGWAAYFVHARTSYNWGRELDQFVRRRLRCVLAGRYAKGVWHQKVPNALLAEVGLISIADTYQAAHRGQLTALCTGTHQA